MAAKTVKVDLPAEIFDVQTNIPLIHQVVVAQQAAARQGTHATKTRGEVRGGGRKPYKQKGTGRARQGSTRAPQFAGGGIVHGPQPRDYDQRTPKKMKAAALRGALSDRARNGRIHVVERLVAGDKPSTKDALRRARRRSPSAPNVLVVLERADDARPGSRCATLAEVHVLARRPAQHLRRARAPTTWSSPRPRYEAFLAGRRQAARPRKAAANRAEAADVPNATSGVTAAHEDESDKDHRDVLIAPVVSEKSYGLLDENKYTFLVRPDANKTEIKIAVEKVFDVKVTSVNTHQPPGQDASHPVRPGQAQGHQARDRQPRRGSPHRHLRRPGLLTGRLRTEELDMAIRKYKPTTPGRRGSSRRRLRRDHPVRRRRSRWSRPLPKKGGRNNQRPHHHPPPRWRPQARLPRHRLPSPRQGRRAGQGRSHRVRPEPHRAHRAAALRRRREALHPRAQAA